MEEKQKIWTGGYTDPDDLPKLDLKKGYVVLPISEYDRLKKIEKEHHKPVVTYTANIEEVCVAIKKPVPPKSQIIKEGETE